MNIEAFAREYCPEVIRRAKIKDDLFDLDFLYFDDIITTDDGYRMRVIYTDDHTIPIMDIISAFDREEFSKLWPYTDCLIAYDNYVSNLIITRGEEVFEEIQRRIAKSMKKLSVSSYVGDVL